MIHLSVRLAWHDDGWNGRICQAPHLNSSCVVHDHIRAARDDDKEKAAAGQHLAELNWLPPCSRDPGAWSPRGFRIMHRDPVGREALLPIPEDIPPYTCTPAPYLWMREESVREICDQENFILEGPRNANKQQGWVTEPTRQRALLKLFWSKVTPGSSLVFYYLRPGVPLDENARRIVVGVGRISEIGTQLYFGNRNPSDELYPIWSRAVSQNFPQEGVRLPYQEYLKAGHDPANIICRLPNGLIPYFSFVAEHVTDDVAVGVLERMIQCVTAVRNEGLVAGDWDGRLNWLNDALAEVWAGRGPFPGIGSVLQYLGCRRGTAYQRLELPALVRDNRSPWEHIVAVLEGHEEPLNAEYTPDFENARRRWRVFGQSRQSLFATLARFELTEAQVERVANPDTRQNAGIMAAETDIIANPYLLYELDLGTNESEPIDLDAIDHGMRPEGDAARFIPIAETAVHDDARRVRAVATAVLRHAAEQGDTVLPFSQLLTRIADHFPDRRACRPDRDVFAAEADFHSEMLWLDMEHEPPLVALQSLQTHEKQIAQRVKRSARRTNAEPDPPIDWEQAIRQGLNPTTEQHFAAVPGQARALAKIYRQRLSALIGGAGTGKTSVLKIFLDQVTTSERRPLLLAPTGKARVRLSSKTGRNAMTIHQFLLRQNWLRTNPFSLKMEGGDQGGAAIVVIDECSMIPTDLFGTLIKALDFNKIKWLVLVGDPNQLPPIGAGRPFVDIVAWMRENAAECLAELRVTTRVVQDEAGARQSDALALADGYRSDVNNPGDDTILAQLAQKQPGSDIELHFWQNHAELQQRIKDTLAEHLQLDLNSDKPDYNILNRSFGISSKPAQQDSFELVEKWQLLSPVRGHPHGTDELNRIIQLTYKGGLIQSCQNRWSKSPKPFGDQEIVYTDKIIQVRNQGRRAYPPGTGLDYVANGEIGVVRSTGKGKKTSDYLDIIFATQPGAAYRYYRGEVNENLELAYALTIHKVQGSEFDYVFIIIPEKAATLSRELIYTGLTRFSERVILLAEKDIATLQNLRRPAESDTLRRNTNLFDLSLRPDEAEGIPYPERLIHRTSTGIMVRSKSEVIVAETLTRHGVSYEYEKKLPARDNPHDFRLPDFTVYFEGDVFYWEHLGMLSVPSYRARWLEKQQWYQANGYADQLLTSEDAPDGSIDVQRLEHTIRERILLE